MSLTSQLDRYLSVRRSLGYDLAHQRAHPPPLHPVRRPRKRRCISTRRCSCAGMPRWPTHAIDASGAAQRRAPVRAVAEQLRSGA